MYVEITATVYLTYKTTHAAMPAWNMVKMVAPVIVKTSLESKYRNTAYCPFIQTPL